jgi:hypothetical protein
MTSAWDLLYLINIAFVFVSWKFATISFSNGNKIGGYANLFASALNASIVLSKFI